MRLAMVMTWVAFGLSGAVDTQEPPQPVLPPPRPMAEAAPEPAKTEPAATEGTATVPQPAVEPLMPPNPAFMDPRAYSWTQHRLPPPDKPCVELACQLGMCLGDHRCCRERICDYLLHWPCPSLLIIGKCCPPRPLPGSTP
jgi:hypothetical protein